MNIDTKQIISMSEANQNFSKVSRTVDKFGEALILKNNKPKYIVLNIENGYINLTDEEKLEVISKRILSKYSKVFKGGSL